MSLTFPVNPNSKLFRIFQIDGMNPSYASAQSDAPVQENAFEISNTFVRNKTTFQ